MDSQINTGKEPAMEWKQTILNYLLVTIGGIIAFLVGFILSYYAPSVLQ